MAERQYSIILKNDTADDKRQTTAPTAKGPDPDKERKKAIKKGAAVVGTAYSTLSTVASYVKSATIDVVSLRTGYEEKQQKLEFAYTVGKTLADMAVSIGMGFAIGNVPGAIVGAASSIGSTVANLAMHQNQINISRQNENTSIFLNQLRMGAGSNREGRTQ